MLRYGRRLLLGLAAALLIIPAAGGQERGTPDEAKALVAEAIALFDAEGPTRAFATFNDPEGEFRDRDLYVFVIAPDNTVVAQGADPIRVGIDVTTLEDSQGRPYGQLILDNATATGAWVDYIRLDPLTNKDLPKSSWVVAHRGYVFGVGVYR
jgi:cytochrome c